MARTGRRSTLISNQLEAGRDANPAIGRAWLIVNPSRRNAVGQPTGYKIMPGADVARPFAHEGASILRRAGFIRHNLWITAYDPSQRYASGDYINQNPAPDGLINGSNVIARSRIRILSLGTLSACTISHGRRTGR